MHMWMMWLFVGVRVCVCVCVCVRACLPRMIVRSSVSFNFKMRLANKFDDVNSRWLFSRRKLNFFAPSFHARFVVVSIYYIMLYTYKTIRYCVG